MKEKAKPIREKTHRIPPEFYMGRTFVSFTMCVRDNHPLFDSRSVVAQMVALLREVMSDHECVIPVYCFMPEHLHVLIEGRSDRANVWDAAVRFKQKSGYWLSSEGIAACWQKDFHDHVMREYEDIKAHVLYVLENPVRRGIVDDWRQYPFSGCIGYASLDEVLSLL